MISENKLKEIYASNIYNSAEIEMKYHDFQSMYGKDALLSLEGKDLLYRLFANKEMNKNSLIYQIEFNMKYDEFGGIKGGSAYKFSLYYSNKENSWIKGSSEKNKKIISEEEAINFATNFRDSIISIIDKIESYKDGKGFISDINYSNIEQFAHQKIGNLCYGSWIMKYFHLIFPKYFVNFFSDNWINKVFNFFDLKKGSNIYEDNYIFSKFANKLGIPNIYLYKIYDKYHDNFSNENKESINNNIESNEKFDKNIIYFGAPGTGKSYLLNLEKSKLINDNSNYERITFYNDYSYGEFVGTYKPVSVNKNGESRIEYKFIPGPFLRLYVKARKNIVFGNNEPVLLIIEEINRANVASVFGDVFQLLDRDEKGNSQYPINSSEDIKNYLMSQLGGELDNYNQLQLPNNYFIWATMNSADQGVFPLDTAFKRRWNFKYIGLNNNDDLIANKYVFFGKGENRKLIEWNKLRCLINDFLSDSCRVNEDKLLGTFFVSKNVLDNGSYDENNNFIINEQIFNKEFKNKVLMYLFEDAAKQKRSLLFPDIKNSTRFSNLLESFDEIGIRVFCSYIIENL